MPFFGDKIKDEDLNDLPEAIQTAIKEADANAKATEERLLKLEEKFGTDTNNPTKETNNPDPNQPKKWDGVSPTEELVFENRMDMILMRMQNDSDKTVAVAVRLFGDKLRQTLQASHPQLRANETYVRNCVNMLKGEKMNEILAEINKPTQDRKFNDFFTESTSTMPNQPVVPNGEIQLSEEEKQVASRYGFTEKEYAEHLKAVREA